MFLRSAVAFYWPPDSVKIQSSPVGGEGAGGEKGLSPISLESESFITLSKQEEACGGINFTSAAATQCKHG